MSPYIKFPSPAALLTLIVQSATCRKLTVRKLASHCNKPIFTLLTVAALAGCASGSALLTGQARPPIEDHTSVAILTEMPDGSELIAVLKASSDSGWTQQRSLDYAVEELKKQAAKVGANAIVLGDRETSTQTLGVPGGDGGTFISSFDREIVQGTAIWME